MPDMHAVEGQTMVANSNQVSENGHNAMMTKYVDDHKDAIRSLHSPDDHPGRGEEYWRRMSPYSQMDHPNNTRLSEADSSSSLKTESDTSSLRSPSSPAYERSHSFNSQEGAPFLNPLPSLANLARSPISSFHNSLVSAAAGNAAKKVTSGGFGMNQLEPLTPVRANGQPEVYYCHLCTFVGQTKPHFDDHMSTHFEHQCPNCDYTSRTEGRLKRHIKDFHSNPDDPENQREHGKPKTMRCRQCNYATQDKYEFWNHQRTHIKDDKMLQCPKCPFVTEYKHHLEYHLRNHFGSKPYKCERCNYSCVNKSMLNSHMKSHTNVYQYRCADCTYATKYCHSLKLHLKKYNHNAATVLNPDGSLPTDGSGDFDLVSKRGPPRGPRGPRKDRSPPPGYTPSLPQMPTQVPMPGFMPGMPPAMWPMMPGKSMFPSNGFLTPPSMLSMPGLSPLCLGIPSPMSGLDGLRPFEMPADDRPGPIPCHLCEYSTVSQHKLLSHLVKSHPLEHQELMRMYPNPLITANPHIKDFSMEVSHKFAGVHSTSSPKVEPPKSSPRLMRHQPEDEFHRRGVAAAMAEDIKAELRQNGECALDLTKSSSSDEGRAQQLNMQGKRKLEDCLSSSDGEQNDQSAGDDATPKKRSRKGKAYKLDTLCMKLQETCSSPTPDGYESDVYSSEFDESNPDSDRLPISTPAEKLNPASHDDPKAAFEQLQQNLAELNGTVPIQALNGGDMMRGDKDEGKDSGNEDHNSTDNSDHVKSCEDLKTSPNEDDSMFTDDSAEKKLLQVSRRLEPHFTKTLADVPEEHIALGNFECCHCGIAFRDCVMFTVHMGYHGYKDPFKCNMCGHLADNRVDFFLHIARAAHE